MVSMGWCDRDGAKTARWSAFAFLPYPGLVFRLRLAALCARTYVRDSAAAAASAMITCIFILHGKVQKRQHHCGNSILFDGLAASATDSLFEVDRLSGPGITLSDVLKVVGT